jgi:hypothetical protein
LLYCPDELRMSLLRVVLDVHLYAVFSCADEGQLARVIGLALPGTFDAAIVVGCGDPVASERAVEMIHRGAGVRIALWLDREMEMISQADAVVAPPIGMAGLLERLRCMAARKRGPRPYPAPAVPAREMAAA